MKQSYEIEIQCPRIFHDFKNEQPAEEGEYLIYFADTRQYVVAEYRQDKEKFLYEDGEYIQEIKTYDTGIFWADLYDISNFIENYLI